MQIEDNPILWSDQFWSALQRAITALTDHPQSALGYRRNTEDGLNIIAIKSLAKDAKLSDRPVFKVWEDKGKDGRVVRRWLQVNHPGAADPMTNVKIFESIYPTPIPPSIVDRIIAYLKAWQSARAKQLKATPGSDDGGSAAEHSTARRTQTQTDTATPATDWYDVQRRLLELYKRGDPYTSLDELAERMGCGRTTIYKAIKDSAKLTGWQARHTKAKGSPRASSLTEVVLDNAEQTREPNPAEEAEANDVDTVFARLIQEAQPEERAQLNDMTGEQRRQLVALVQNDPDRYDRVLGRKP